MQPHQPNKLFLIPALLAAVALNSCVDAGYSGGGYGSVGVGGPPPSYGGYQTFSTLPGNYSGNAYLYNGRYYSGGRYETGRYQDQGRSYSNRYFYDGRYYYGGTHQHHNGTIHSNSSSHTQFRPARSIPSNSRYPASSQYRGSSSHRDSNDSWQNRSHDERDPRHNTSDPRGTSRSPFPSLFQAR